MSIKPAPGCKVRYGDDSTSWTLWDRAEGRLKYDSCVFLEAGTEGEIVELPRKFPNAAVIRFPKGEILMNENSWEIIVPPPIPRPLVLKPRRKLHLAD